MIPIAVGTNYFNSKEWLYATPRNITPRHSPNIIIAHSVNSTHLAVRVCKPDNFCMLVMHYTITLHKNVVNKNIRMVCIIQKIKLRAYF